MREEIVGTGTGGQGIQLMIHILSLALHNQSRDMASKPDYGPEVRGGKSSAYSVVKDFPEDWPEIMESDILIALSQEGFEVWIEKIKKDALIFCDPALVKCDSTEAKKYYIVPASEIAQELKDKRVINMAMLGGVIKITKLISIENVLEALKQEGKYSEANKKALEKGYKRVCEIK